MVLKQGRSTTWLRTGAKKPSRLYRLRGCSHENHVDAKNGFGLLLDTARAELVTIEKHGRAVAVVIAVEVYEDLLKNRRKPFRSNPAPHTRRLKA